MRTNNQMESKDSCQTFSSDDDSSNDQDIEIDTNGASNANDAIMKLGITNGVSTETDTSLNMSMKRKHTPSTQKIDCETKKRKLNEGGKTVDDDRTTTPDEEKEKEQETGKQEVLNSANEETERNSAEQREKGVLSDEFIYLRESNVHTKESPERSGFTNEFQNETKQESKNESDESDEFIYLRESNVHTKESPERSGFTNEFQNETKQESKNESDEQKNTTSPDTSNASDEEDVRLNDASTISRPEAIKFPKLYRLLANKESITDGLEAKDPDSDRGVATHVATGSNGHRSKYISTCQSLPDARKLRNLKSRSRRFRNGTKDIAEIDVNKLPSDVEIIDLTSEELRRRHEHKFCDDTNRKFHKHAEEFSEVLIVGKVPPECLRLVD